MASMLCFRKISKLLLFALICLGGCSKDNDSNGPDHKKIGNLQATGDSARDILANENYNRLFFQLAYVSGYKPSEEAIANFTTFIKSVSHKEQVDFSYIEVPATGEESLSIEEVDDLEQEHRTAYNNGNTLAVYVFFADTGSEKDAESDNENSLTLGSVYRNTSMVIYEATIKDFAKKSALIEEADVETITLNHEFAHLLGLVDLGTAMQQDHEDPDALNHCSAEECLMRAELRFTIGVAKALTARGLIVPELDAQCLADLRANGGR